MKRHAIVFRKGFAPQVRDMAASANGVELRELPVDSVAGSRGDIAFSDVVIALDIANDEIRDVAVLKARFVIDDEHE